MIPGLNDMFGQKGNICTAQNNMVETIKRRQAEAWDIMHVGSDPSYDLTTTQAIVNEYDELLIEIGAIKRQEAESA